MNQGLEDLNAFIVEIARDRPNDREKAQARLRFLAKGAFYDAIGRIEDAGDVIAASREAQAVAGAVYVAALLIGRN